VLGFISCKKESSDSAICSDSLAIVMQERLEVVDNAALEFYSTPAKETCDEYKDALRYYIDGLYSFLDCKALTNEEKEGLLTDIDEAEYDISTLCTETCDDDLTILAQENTNIVLNTYTVFYQNPNLETCNACKNALRNFIDVLMPFLNCPTLSFEEQQELQEAIDQANEDYNTLLISCPD